MLDDLMLQNPEFKAFVSKIDRLARKFEFEKLCFCSNLFLNIVIILFAKCSLILKDELQNFSCP